MKAYWILLLLVVNIFAACDRQEKQIRKNAYNYSFSMANYNVDQAAPYATNETKNTTLVMAKRLIKSVGEEYIASDKPAQIEIMEISKLSDTTAYVVYRKTTPIKDFTDTLQMRKREGVWLAHATIPIVQKQQSENPDS